MEEKGTLGKDLTSALQAVVIVDVVFLVLPALFLTGLSASVCDGSLQCGWSSHKFQICSAVAICAIWLSIVVASAQLVSLTVICPDRRSVYARRLWHHLPFLLISTAAGGALGIYVLSGYISLSLGLCHTGVAWSIAVVIFAAYIWAGTYLVLSYCENRRSCLQAESSSHDLVTDIDAVMPVPDIERISHEKSKEEAFIQAKRLCEEAGRIMGPVSGSAPMEDEPKLHLPSAVHDAGHTASMNLVAHATMLASPLSQDVPHQGEATLTSGTLTARRLHSDLPVISPFIHAKRSKSPLPSKSKHVMTDLMQKEESNTLIAPAGVDTLGLPAAQAYGCQGGSTSNCQGPTELKSRATPSCDSSSESCLASDNTKSYGINEVEPHNGSESCQLHDKYECKRRTSGRVASKAAPPPTPRAPNDNVLVEWQEIEEELMSEFSLPSLQGQTNLLNQLQSDFPCEISESMENRAECLPAIHEHVQAEVVSPSCGVQGILHAPSTETRQGNARKRHQSVSFSLAPSVIEMRASGAEGRNLDHFKHKSSNWTPSSGINTSHVEGISGALPQPVVLYERCPIDFTNLSNQLLDSSSSSEDESCGGELWSASEQVEIPIWLLEKLKQSGRNPDASEVGSKEEDATYSNDETDSSDGDQDSDNDSPQGHADHSDDTRPGKHLDTRPPAISITVADSEACDEDKDDTMTENSSRISPKKLRALMKEGGKDGTDVALVPSSSFWKIPMPTRRGTVMHDAEQEADQDDEDESLEPSTPASAVPVRRGFRRRSVLGVFSDDSAKAPGLYALPKTAGNHGEVVEVKRHSLVMSESMLTDILRSKIDTDRIEAISEDDVSTNSEVVLPFFGQAQRSEFRKCQCKKDAVTGYVIHTCMTPSTTQATNTGCQQSYICSEWSSKKCSRRNSDRNSVKAVKGNSEHTSLLPKTGKRIRNASMLALVGQAGPVPSKKNTDEPGFAHFLEKCTDARSIAESEQPEEENELLVSFKSIQEVESQRASRRSSAANLKDDAPLACCDPFAEGQHARDCYPSPDRQVENELGHRFDMVEPWELMHWLGDADKRDMLLVVDVRGRDWVGGHIPSSINLRTSEVVRNPDRLLLQCRRDHIQQIVFTCMYSVLRARKCAAAVERAQQEEQKTGHAAYKLGILVLTGGVHKWVNHFVRDNAAATQAGDHSNSLVDGYDAECWCDGGPSQGGLVHVMDALWTSGGQKALSEALNAELENLAMSRTDNSSPASGTADVDAPRNGSNTQAQVISLPGLVATATE